MSTTLPKLASTITVGGSAGGDCYWVTVNGVRTKICGIDGRLIDSVPDGGDGQMPPGLLRALEGLKRRLSDIRGGGRDTYAGYLRVESKGEIHKVHLVHSVDAKGQAHIVGHSDTSHHGDLLGSSALEDGHLTVHLKGARNH